MSDEKCGGFQVVNSSSCMFGNTDGAVFASGGFLESETELIYTDKPGRHIFSK